MARKLTLKQRNFVQNYIENGGNATKAAMDAYNTIDYKTAQNIGSENLSNPIIAQAVEDTIEKRGGVTKDKFVQMLEDLVQDRKHPKHEKYCQMLMAVTGWEAPKRSEIKQETKLQLEQAEKDEINREIRQNLEHALKN